MLLLGSAIWLQTTAATIMLRMSQDTPWARMLIIMLIVAVFTIFSAFLLKERLKNEKYEKIEGTPGPSAAAFLLTAAFLGIAKIKVNFPILIVDRFFPGSGWIEILFLSVYAAWLVEKLIRNHNYIKYRLYI